MFAIYIPGRHRNDESILREVGAGWALDPSVTAMFLDVEVGPDGGAGKLIYFESRRRPLGSVTAVSQANWLPAAKAGEQAEGRYWIGVSKERKPGPDDLERADRIDGLPLVLLDKNEWWIPIADYCPQRLKLNRKTGEQECQPFEQYREFTERTNAMFRLLVGDEFQERVKEELRVQIPDGLAYASLALEQNYRINLDLADMLDLVGEIEAVKIAGITTSLELLEVADNQKKTPRLLALPSCDV